MTTRIKSLIGLSVFLSTGIIGGFYPTNASALGCNFFFASTPTVCGDSSVVGGSNFLGGVTSSPDPVFTEQSGGPVAVGAAGSGPGGISGATTATGSFGEAHVSASANTGQFTSPTAGSGGDQVNVSAQGIIGFIDGFSISAPLNVRITMSMNGVFTGQQTAFGTTFPQPGTAEITFLFDTGNQHLISTDKFFSQSFSSSQDILLQPGIYTFLWSLEARAAAVADLFSVTPSQTADASNTGHLFFDVLTPGASLTFLSGHDYSSSLAEPLATPLPAALPLFATGLGALGLLGWRRKKKAAALAA
jgi:hypothetical protein